MTEIPTMDKRVLKIDQEPKAPALPADDPLAALPANEKETLKDGRTVEKMFSMKQYTEEDGAEIEPYKFTLRTITQQIANLREKADLSDPGDEPETSEYAGTKEGEAEFDVDHNTWDRKSKRYDHLTDHADMLESAKIEAAKK